MSYAEFGSGPRTVVLLHGLLFSGRMHEPLARALAARGNRVVTLDLLGHGRSDRPRDMWRYSMSFFAEQTVGAARPPGRRRGVVLGTSLGANTTLEIAALAPERLRGMVIEMPVLDGALIACGLAFLPAMVAMKYGEPGNEARAAGGEPRAARVAAVPARRRARRRAPGPRPGRRGARGPLLRPHPPHRSQRRTFRRPTLVIGHPATPSTRCPTPGCSPTSCPTDGCSRPARSSSCASRPSA
jgi:pimeloyl-ACP methyl ester carboxylesterase